MALVVSFRAVKRNDVGNEIAFWLVVHIYACSACISVMTYELIVLTACGLYVVFV